RAQLGRRAARARPAALRPWALTRRRRPDRGPERIPPPRRDRAGGLDLLARRPWLDERHGGGRPSRAARAARRRLALHHRRDDGHLLDRAGIGTPWRWLPLRGFRR